MAHQPPNERLIEAQRIIGAVLGEQSDKIGPVRFDGDGEPEWDNPIEGALLSEWVLVCCWVDPAAGEPVTSMISSENLLRTHRIGLLHEALYGMD